MVMRDTPKLDHDATDATGDAVGDLQGNLQGTALL